MKSALNVNKKSFTARFRQEALYHAMIWVGIVFIFIFCYIPMSGLIISFKEYSLRDGMLASPWVGLKYFKQILADYYMANALINTLGIALLSVLISFPCTILFTLMLNELVSVKFKKVVQTVSYLPHFISWAVMAIILDSMLSPSTGVINMVLTRIGILKEPVLFLGRADLYWWVVVIAGVWKELGWSSIIYLAVISGIDETLYEAAQIDGAGKLQKMWYITLPHLKEIIAIMLILTMGGILTVGFDTSYFLSNSLNFERSNVLSYYVYTIGLRKANFSYSAAISLLTAVVSSFLMLTTNSVVKKINGSGVF